MSLVAKRLAERYPDHGTDLILAEYLAILPHVDADVGAVLAAARAHAKVVLLSNSTDRLHADVNALGLAASFDAVVSSADTRCAKPLPGAFLAAARTVGVPPQSCLFVDDRADNVAAAAAVGMTSTTFACAEELAQTIEQWRKVPTDAHLTRHPPARDRDAVRVVCTNADGDVLLLRWQDPVSGELLWEPPGGRVESGETGQAAAARELREETGTVAAVDDRCVAVQRNYLWCGKHQRNTERFYHGVAPDGQPSLDTQLSARERSTLKSMKWWRREELLTTIERIEPFNLLTVLRELGG
jgi:HAD superfamily hydrolase (TIGR01509 family)